MWRKNGSLMSYVYLPKKKESCGADWDYNSHVTAGGWNEVSMYIKVNTVGARHPKLHCSILSLQADRYLMPVLHMYHPVVVPYSSSVQQGLCLRSPSQPTSGSRTDKEILKNQDYFPGLA